MKQVISFVAFFVLFVIAGLLYHEHVTRPIPPNIPATFYNVRVTDMDAKAIFIQQHGEKKVERVKVCNASFFEAMLRWQKEDNQEVNITMVPVGAEWKILGVSLAETLPPLPKN